MILGKSELQNSQHSNLSSSNSKIPVVAAAEPKPNFLKATEKTINTSNKHTPDVEAKSWRQIIRSIDHFFVKHCIDTNDTDCKVLASTNVLNRYEILSGAGQRIFYAIETSNNSVLKLLFGPLRAFHIKVYDSNGQLFLNIKHSFSCLVCCCGGHYCGNKMTVTLEEDDDGYNDEISSVSEIGKILQKTKFHPTYDVKLYEKFEMKTNVSPLQLTTTSANETDSISGSTKAPGPALVQTKGDMAKVPEPIAVPPKGVAMNMALAPESKLPSSSENSDASNSKSLNTISISLSRNEDNPSSSNLCLRIPGIKWLNKQCSLWFQNPKFDILDSSDQIIGQLTNKWNTGAEEDSDEDGDVEEINLMMSWIRKTHEDISGISFLKNLDDNNKLMLLGGLFLVHSLYYDRKNGKLTGLDGIVYLLLLLLALYGIVNIIMISSTVSNGHTPTSTTTTTTTTTTTSPLTSLNLTTSSSIGLEGLDEY